MAYFEYWLLQATKGDSFAARLVWSALGTAVQERKLSDSQWQLLSDLLDAANREPAPNKLMVAANSALRLGRRPGKAAVYQVEARHLSWAQQIFDEHGVVKGRQLDRAAEDLAQKVGLGHDPDRPADLRPIKRAYRAHLQLMLEIYKLASETVVNPNT